MSVAESRKFYLASGKNEIETHGREAEIDYKNFLLEYILSGESFNDLDEALFDFKDAGEEERIIREKAAFLFKTVADPEILKAILELNEAVFNFVAISDAAPRVERAIVKKTKRDGTEEGRKARSELSAALVSERQGYVRQILASYTPEEIKHLKAKKVAYELSKIIENLNLKPQFSILAKEIGKDLKKIAQEQSMQKT